MRARQKAAEPDKGEEELTTFQSDVLNRWRSGYNILAVETTDEAATRHALLTAPVRYNKATAVESRRIAAVFWDAVRGFYTVNENDVRVPLLKEATSPIAALDAMISDTTKLRRRGWYIFSDLDDYMTDAGVRSRIRRLHEDSLLCIGDQARMMILLSPRLTIHDKIKNCITIVDWPLPTDAQIDQSIAMIWETYAANNNLPPIAPQEREEVVENLRGLTVNEVDNILAMVVQANRGFGPAGMRMLCEEKARSLKKGEILTSITNVTDPSEIGGFGNVLEFVADRKDAYTREARAQKIDLPRGIALWGVPGTGKSLVARAICNLLGKPGLRMDIGAIFAGLVGESEARMRQTLKQVSAHRGCVLFVDEIDKAFANVGRSTGDSGVGQRILGQFLTWLEEHKDAAFTIVTANRLDVLPPELLRAGRFDAIFYTDLPTAKEREQILRIHLRKRDVDPDKLPTGVKTMMGRDEWDALIADTTDFVGAELERVVCDARYKSFKNRRHGVPTFDELIMAARATVPMAVRDADEIQKIREACAGRAIPASIQDTVSGGLRQVN